MANTATVREARPGECAAWPHIKPFRPATMHGVSVRSGDSEWVEYTISPPVALEAGKTYVVELGPPEPQPDIVTTAASPR